MSLRVLLFIFVLVLIVGEQANGSKPALPDELMKARTLAFQQVCAFLPCVIGTLNGLLPR
jgi:hypothetical protein